MILMNRDADLLPVTWNESRSQWISSLEYDLLFAIMLAL